MHYDKQSRSYLPMRVKESQPVHSPVDQNRRILCVVGGSSRRWDPHSRASRSLSLLTAEPAQQVHRVGADLGQLPLPR